MGETFYKKINKNNLSVLFYFQVDISGFMAFWGLTIDTVTTIILVIAIGLTVDYSAHIAHGFMATRGKDKNGKHCVIL